MVREVTAPVVRFVKRRRDPSTVWTVRSAAAATIAFVIALRLSPEAAPLTAPLTALRPPATSVEVTTVCACLAVAAAASPA